MNRDIEEYTRAFRDRDSLRLPIKLCEILDYEEAAIKAQSHPEKIGFFTSCCGSSKKKRYFVDDEFIKAFDKLSMEEKIQLYSKTVQYLARISKGESSVFFHVQNDIF